MEAASEHGRSMRLTLAITLVLLALAPQGHAAGVDHVILVFVDGPRYAESFGDPSRIPRIWNDLRPAGTILTGFRNQGATYTCSGHATTICGRQQDLANDGSEYPHDLTLAERDRLASASAAEDFWVVAGKAKLHMLAYSDDTSGGAAYGSNAIAGLGGDLATMDALYQVLVQHQPRLVVVNLPDVDVRGHAGDWDGYLDAISTADSLMGALWDYLQSEPAFAGKSALVVTADHGRHDNRPLEAHDGFADHGDACEGCRRIWLTAVGAGIRSGTVVEGTHAQVDLAATIAQLLDIDATGMEGFPIWEMLEPPTAAPIARGGELRYLGSRPAPLRGAGKILLRAGEGAALRLRIFDARGRLVREFTRDVGSAGELLVPWDGRDLEGRAVAGGVYHLLLEDGVERDRGPLLLLR